MTTALATTELDPRGAAVSALETMAGQKAITLNQYAQLWMAGMEGTLTSSLNLPLKPYQQSLWVYRCLYEIQKTLSGIPLRIVTAGEGLKYAAKSFEARIRPTAHRTLKPVKGYKSICVGRAAEGELIESGPAYDLLNRPNGYQTWPQFMVALAGYLKLRGKVAIVMTDMTGRKPGGLHVVDGRYVEPQWARDENQMPVLLGYKYTAPKTHTVIPFAVDEVKYFALWDDSDDPLGGMSPTVPGRLAISTEYNASLYNASSLVNSCEPGFALTFPANLTDEQRDQFRDALRQRHQGPAKAKLPIILEAGGDIKALATSMADMQFDQGKKTNRLEICCLLGTPPVVAGWVDAAGDSSAYTSNALRQFYQQTIFPDLDFFAPAIQEIASRFDARAVTYFDVEDQPVVQEMRLARLESAKKYFDMGYPVNAINGVLDLGMPEQVWGDTGLLPINLMPAADVAAGSVIEPVAEGPEAEDSDGLGQSYHGPLARGHSDHSDHRRDACGTLIDHEVFKAAVDRLWQAFARSWQPLAKRMAGMLRNHFSAQQRKLLTALQSAAGEGITGVSVGTAGVPPVDSITGQRPVVQKIDETIIARILLQVFGDRKDRLTFRNRVKAFVADTNELGLRQSLTEAGFEGDTLTDALRRLQADPSITQAMSSETVRISTLIDDRSRTVLRRSLIEGLGEGEDARHLADRVQHVMGVRRRQSMTVARNSVGQSLSRSRYDGRCGAGMTHEVWIHSRGPGERRDTHIAAERTYARNPKPIGQPFVVGGVRLRYPRDFASGSMEETVNCQCLALGKRIAAGRRATAMEIIREHLARSFVTYDEMIAARSQGTAEKKENTE